jgi:serine/threonine-protein kinase RIO1
MLQTHGHFLEQDSPEVAQRKQLTAWARKEIKRLRT